MHPDPWTCESRDESNRIAAWRTHYIAKGCNSTKADMCAHRKVRQSHTWPPNK